ncbi:hypothetical protein PYCC9005_004963 [Savitreella phatthalungensis]
MTSSAAVGAALSRAWVKLQDGLRSFWNRLKSALHWVLGFTEERFSFDAYTQVTDEFDHLLSTDPTSGSFFSRFTRRRSRGRASDQRRRSRATTRTVSSTDGSLASLLENEIEDPESLGDDSIGMLATATDEQLADEERRIEEEEEARVTEGRRRAQVALQAAGAAAIPAGPAGSAGSAEPAGSDPGSRSISIASLHRDGEDGRGGEGHEEGI